jgi:hypothetical protein
MLSQIQGCYTVNEKIHSVDIFAYTTSGIGGLEINGLGAFGKIIKEKIIFISKSKGLRFPSKRFCISVDIPLHNLQEKGRADLRWLELPILLIFWHQTGHLNIYNIESLVGAGTVAAHGYIHVMEIPEKVLYLIQEENKIKKRTDTVYLCPDKLKINYESCVRRISIMELLKHLENSQMDNILASSMNLVP